MITKRQKSPSTNKIAEPLLSLAAKVNLNEYEWLREQMRQKQHYLNCLMKQ